MPRHASAHTRASGNRAFGSPPSRGRTGLVGLTAATAFFAAALLPLSLRPAIAAEPDLAFGAFQTGHYLTAFGIATNRVELRRPEVDDASGRALCRRARRAAERRQGRRMVQACRRPRRPRSDVCARHVSPAGPRRPARPRRRRQMACGRGQARPSARGLRSRAALHGRPVVSAGFHPRRRIAAHRGASR